MSKEVHAFCALCVAIGYVLPWALLAGGVGLSIINPDGGPLAAGLIVASLIAFMLVAGAARIMRRHVH